MRHRAARVHAVVAALLLALAAMLAAVGVASLTSSAEDPSAVMSSRPHEGAEPRHDVLAPRALSVSSKAGIHLAGPDLHVLAVAAALAAALLLVGWLVGERGRRALPRLVAAPLGARAPPALV